MHHSEPPHSEPLPVLVGRTTNPYKGIGRSLQGADLKGKREVTTLPSETLSPIPFSKVESVGSNDSTLLKEILTDALVSPVSALPEDSRSEEKFPDASASSNEAKNWQPIYVEAKSRDVRRSARSKTGSETNKEKPQSIPRSSSGHFKHRSTFDARPLMEQETVETAATNVQKHYRGHRVRLQMPKSKAQLETVEEEGRKKVTFAESPTATTDKKDGRAFARKSTPFIKKEDIPAEEYGVEIVTNELPRDEAGWNLRSERKLTGFIKQSDLPDESDAESEVPHSPLSLSQRKLTGFIKQSDLPDESDAQSEVPHSPLTNSTDTQQTLN